MSVGKVRVAGIGLMSVLLATGGCKKTTPAPAAAPATNASATAGAPVLNSDGTYTNPNGTVTAPAGTAAAQAQAPPSGGIAIRNQDGSITNPDGSVTYPAGSAVAKRENNPNGAQNLVPAPPPAQDVNHPAPIVEAPAVTHLTVPVGTPLVVRLNGGLAASRNDVGDRWSGSLERPVVYHGTTIFERGTAVSGEVVASKGKGRFKGAGDLGIEVTAIGRDRVESSEYEKVAKGRGKRTAGFIGGGAGLGALIGGIAGHGKGALIGGLAGAGAGTAAGAYTGGRDVVIPSESVITFRLRESVTR